MGQIRKAPAKPHWSEVDQLGLDIAVVHKQMMEMADELDRIRKALALKAHRVGKKYHELMVLKKEIGQS